MLCLVLCLVLFSEISFAEDDEIDSSQNEEVIEQENNSEEPVENEEPAEIVNPEPEPIVDREESYEREEQVDYRSDGMDEQEREHAQKIEDLEAAYAREQADQNNGENVQQPNEGRNRNNRVNKNSERPKRNKSLKALERSQRAERRTQRENIHVDTNHTQNIEEQNNTQQSGAKSSYGSSENKEIDPENFVCDPIVSLQIQNELRFDILKELADEYGFEITILESENKLMSIEKNQPLSKVIESITRDMSVVLNFKKIKDCNRLVAIAVLDNNEWSGSGGGSGGPSESRFIRKYSSEDGSENLQRYKPKFEAPKLVEIENPEPMTAEQLEEKRLRQEQRKAQRLEHENVRSLNDELVNGSELKAQYNVKGDDWKKDINETRVEIPDMEEYVQQVIDGERQPDLRKMSLKQRSEYMKLRRELRAQQTE